MVTTDTTRLGEFDTKQVADLRTQRRRSIDNAARTITSNIPGVIGVCLFGDHVRDVDKDTSTIDLVVISDAIHEKWLRWLPQALEHEDWDIHGVYNWDRICRINALLAVTGIDPESTWSDGDPLCGSRATLMKLNIFVFPSNWRDPVVLEHLQNAGSHLGPGFMECVARDAIKYDQSAGTFWPSETH